MTSDHMNSVPISLQMRAIGCRVARAEECSVPISLSYNGKSTEFQVVGIPDLCEPAMVSIMRGFADMFWDVFPEATLERVVVAVCDYSELIGATNAEVVLAVEGLGLTRV